MQQSTITFKLKNHYKILPKCNHIYIRKMTYFLFAVTTKKHVHTYTYALNNVTNFVSASNIQLSAFWNWLVSCDLICFFKDNLFDKVPTSTSQLGSFAFLQ